MAAEREPVEVESDSDGVRLIRDAVDSGPVLIVVDGSVYELEAHPASVTVHQMTLRDSLSNLIGILGDGEPTDVAHHLDEYLAKAYEPRS